MLYGINITSLNEWPIAQKFFKEGIIDFIEIIIDNFKHSDPKLLYEIVSEIPHAIHIMTSRFIEISDFELDTFYKALEPAISILNPIYISDHLARFNLDGVSFPYLMELDYYSEKTHIHNRISHWQNMLCSKLHLETFPSMLETGLAQAEFFSDLLEKNSQIGVLFDVSNLIVAELNSINSFSKWDNVISKANHFHVSGYSYSKTSPELVIDSHNTPISSLTLETLTRKKRIINKPENTIVIERDFIYDEEIWKQDIVNVRNALDVKHAYQTIA